MRGGARKNAGRNKINPNKKKISKSVKLRPELCHKIDSLVIQDCDSFSSKCQSLIEKAIASIEVENLKESHKMKFIDLFAGVGGIRQGFEDNLRGKFW